MVFVERITHKNFQTQQFQSARTNRVHSILRNKIQWEDAEWSTTWSDSRNPIWKRWFLRKSDTGTMGAAFVGAALLALPLEVVAAFLFSLAAATFSGRRNSDSMARAYSREESDIFIVQAHARNQSTGEHKHQEEEKDKWVTNLIAFHQNKETTLS